MHVRNVNNKSPLPHLADPRRRTHMIIISRSISNLIIRNCFLLSTLVRLFETRYLWCRLKIINHASTSHISRKRKFTFHFWKPGRNLVKRKQDVYSGMDRISLGPDFGWRVHRRGVQVTGGGCFYLRKRLYSATRLDAYRINSQALGIK